MGKIAIIPELEGLVTNIINSMPNLTSYAVDLHRITNKIIKAIDNNHS
jgi:hypothetical protein